MTTDQEIKEEVRKRYGAAAQRASAGCCGTDDNAVTSALYTTDEIRELPKEALLASLGCGNPVAIAEMREGEVVLDLGSGGGIDVLLSARRVGPAGKAYGLDMTDEMLQLAKENARKAGVTNVQFLRGEMENIPLPSEEVDVIISNCVVNLSPDKDAVLREAYRVLKPGGRIAIADIVTRGVLPEAIQKSMAAWTGCVAGALSIDDYTAKLRTAGFEGIEIESFREYSAEDAESSGFGAVLQQVGKKGRDSLGILSAVVRATKPAGAKKVLEPVSVVASDRSASCDEQQCC
jgi:ubiquinone/menaquinone biosynthesis C-methylase UbiE